MPKILCTSCNKQKSQSSFFKSGGTYGTHCSNCRSFARSIINWKKQGIKIDSLEYKNLAESQMYCCKICGDRYPNWTLKPAKRLAVDHKHGTDIIRGLLCSRCNVGIGMFRDSPELMLKAAEYLKKPGFRSGMIGP